MRDGRSKNAFNNSFPHFVVPLPRRWRFFGACANIYSCPLPEERRLAGEPRFAPQIGGGGEAVGCGMRKVRRLFYALSRKREGSQASPALLRKSGVSRVCVTGVECVKYSALSGYGFPLFVAPSHPAFIWVRSPCMLCAPSPGGGAHGVGGGGLAFPKRGKAF